MPVCPECGRYLDRLPRTFLQRAVYACVFQCRCGYRLRPLHARLRARLLYASSRHTHCVGCGSPDVVLSPDGRIEAAAHPLLRLGRLLRGTVYNCTTCRTQYCDWRAPAPRPRADI